MAGIAYRNLLIGKEAVATPGIAAARTDRLTGGMTISQNRPLHIPRENRVSLAMNKRSSTISRMSSLQWTCPASYEQLIYLLSMSVKGRVATVGAAAPYSYDFTPDIDGPNLHNTYSIQYGDSDASWLAPFCFCKAWRLSLAQNNVCELQADIQGNFAQRLAAVPATPAALTSWPDITDIAANSAKVYIDDSWANLGNTEYSGLVTGGDIMFTDTGLMAIKTLNGTHDYEVIQEGERALEINLELLVNSDGISEYDGWYNEVLRAVRVEMEGPIIAGADRHKLTIDCIGKYTNEPQLLGEKENANIFQLQLASFEDNTPAKNEFAFNIVTDVDIDLTV